MTEIERKVENALPPQLPEVRPKFHGPRYLVILHTVSSGDNGPDLGGDETDIGLLLYTVYDTKLNKVKHEHEFRVRPRNDLAIKNAQAEGNAEYSLYSETAKILYGLGNGTEEHSDLESVLEEAHSRVFADLANNNNEDGNESESSDILNSSGNSDISVNASLAAKRFCLLTDGQNHLRQQLFPEAWRKGVRLHDYYYKFHDLRKEFAEFKKSQDNKAGGVNSIEDMLAQLGLNSEVNTANGPEGNKGQKDVKNMVAILNKLICDGISFHDAEPVRTNLESGILTRGDTVDGDCVIRARGLPWQASDQDIASFFIGLNLAKGGVALCLSSQGRRNGEALVLFENPAHRDLAIRRHKHHIGNRYIEVYKANGEDFINVAGGNNKEAQQFLARGGQVIVRMRGLPYDCTAKQVIDFFKAGEAQTGKNNCDVHEGEDGILFVRRPDGRATGDAFVLFREEDEAEKALKKHKDNIGSRYIELFRSTTAEVQQVLNRTMEQHNQRQAARNASSSSYHQSTTPNLQAAHHQYSAALAALAAVNVNNFQSPLLPHLPTSVSALLPPPPQPAQSALLPTPSMPAVKNPKARDFLRMRNLPLEAQVEHILDFLGDHAKNIRLEGVHMVQDQEHKPCGEAFIHMTTEAAAGLAAAQRHYKTMNVNGSGDRWIEVFQCSEEDMNVALGKTTPTKDNNPAAAAAALAAATNTNQGLDEQSLYRVMGAAANTATSQVEQQGNQDQQIQLKASHQCFQHQPSHHQTTYQTTYQEQQCTPYHHHQNAYHPQLPPNPRFQVPPIAHVIYLSHPSPPLSPPQQPSVYYTTSTNGQMVNGFHHHHHQLHPLNHSQEVTPAMSVSPVMEVQPPLPHQQYYQIIHSSEQQQNKDIPVTE